MGESIIKQGDQDEGKEGRIREMEVTPFVYIWHAYGDQGNK